MSDRLALAHVIEDAGIPRDKAENVATAIARFVEGSAATKADIDRVEAALKADIAAVRADLRQVETRLAGEITSARGDIGRTQDRVVIRLSGVMVVLLGILFAALKWHS
jgi:hypothetical protein